MRKAIQLTSVSKEDVARIQDWLRDPEISENWFGRYTYGDPAHTGYHPDQALKCTDEQWETIFNNGHNQYSFDVKNLIIYLAIDPSWDLTKSPDNDQGVALVTFT